MKKIILLLTIFILGIFVLGAVGASAATYGNLTYEISNNEITITDCNTTVTSVEIPSVINNYPVTKIGELAFSGCSSLKSVTIPESVTSIGIYAFSYCSSLTSVNIPSYISSIGKSTFSGCSSLTSVTIPESVTSIGNDAFLDCSSLTSVNIPAGVSTIGTGAFYNCKALESINIPETVTKIESSAFQNCSNLKKVNITNLEKWCKISFSTLDANPLYNGKGELWLNGNIVETLTIPSSVTKINKEAFSGCSSIKTLNLGNYVSEIGALAFSSCKNLTTVKFGSSVKTVGNGAFSGCYKIESVYIDSLSQWLGITFVDTYSSFSTSNPLLFAKSFYVNGELLENLVIPQNVKIVPEGIFYGYSGLKSVVIPEGVTKIEKYAFSQCDVLSSVKLPESLTEIGVSAFSNCTSLTTITIPAKVTKISGSAFYECKCLNEIYWNAVTVADFDEYNDRIFEGTNITKFIFGNSVKKLPAYIKAGYGAEICYIGTKEEFDKINFSAGNSHISSANVKFLVNVRLLDKDGNELSNKLQSIGEVIDLSEIEIPDYNIIKLYTDKEMQTEYPVDKPIEQCILNLYTKVYHPLLNKIEISGTDSAVVGSENVKKAVSFATDKDATVIYFYIRYPQTLTLKEIMPKDFEYVEMDDQYTENGYTTTVIIAMYNADWIPKQVIYTPFELSFDVSRTAECGIVEIEATEESTMIGNDEFSFDERISGRLELLPKLAEGIEILGADVISSESTYTSVVTPDYTTNKNVVWSVDSEDIATVDEFGIVTPVTSGTFTLIATAADGGGVFATKTVTVTRFVENIEIVGAESITEATAYTANISPDYATNKDIEWTIDDEAIAVIDQNGVVTPVTSGVVTITVTAKDGSGIFATKEIVVIKIEILGEESISSPAQYTAIVSPDYTTNKTVLWTVDNEEIATVDEFGIVTPVTSGMVVLTATAADGSEVFANKIIEIVKYAESIEIVGEEEITQPSQYSVVILPEYTTNKNANWSVSDESVATVDENGLVTPLKNGKIVLTATAEDASGIVTTKSIVITVSVRASSIITDIGVWDKAFDADITQYTIYAPKTATQISFTPKTENATVKVNGSIVGNGRSKRVYLNNDETVVEITLTPTSGNQLKANTYTVTVVKFEGTKTTVSEDKKNFEISALNVEEGTTVVLALYDNEKLVEVQSDVFAGENVKFKTKKSYTDAKVMVLESLESLKPVCEAEIIK